MTESAKDVLTRVVSKWRAPTLPYPEFLQFLDRGQVYELLDALADAGFAVVPVEPTQDMLDAGNSEEFAASDGDQDYNSSIPEYVTEAIYRVMIAARPR